MEDLQAKLRRDYQEIGPGLMTYRPEFYYIQRNHKDGTASERVVSKWYWWYMRLSRPWKWKVWKRTLSEVETWHRR